MSAMRVAAVAAVGAVVLWAAKAVAIGLAGGLDRSALESPLLLIGFLSLLVAYTAAGVAAMGSKGPVAKVAGGLAGLVVFTIAFLLLENAVSAAVPASAGWVREEAGLWVGSAITAAVVLYAWRRSSERVLG